MGTPLLLAVRCAGHPASPSKSHFENVQSTPLLQQGTRSGKCFLSSALWLHWSCSAGLPKQARTKLEAHRTVCILGERLMSHVVPLQGRLTRGATRLLAVVSLVMP